MTPANVTGLAARILQLQRADGSIPWVDSGVVDPWNHVEAAMGLNVAGCRAASDKAFRWLAASQRADGSWLADIGAAAPMDFTTDTIVSALAPKAVDLNFNAYIATGLAHHWRRFGDLEFLERMAPAMIRAIDFVVERQREDGAFPWCDPDDGAPALVTGCASIWFSLANAIAVERLMQRDRPAWREAFGRLSRAFAQFPVVCPQTFDRSWEKSRHAMDWYYPVLVGLETGREARRRLARDWDRFVIEGAGCRCVSDEPWATAAESAELALALACAGQTALARRLLEWAGALEDPRGGLWMGWQCEQERVWPRERPSWTAAAALLAIDAVYQVTPAWSFFHDAPSALLTPGAAPKESRSD